MGVLQERGGEKPGEQGSGCDFVRHGPVSQGQELGNTRDLCHSPITNMGEPTDAQALPGCTHKLWGFLGGGVSCCMKTRAGRGWRISPCPYRAEAPADTLREMGCQRAGAHTARRSGHTYGGERTQLGPPEHLTPTPAVSAYTGTAAALPKPLHSTCLLGRLCSEPRVQSCPPWGGTPPTR